MCKRMEDDASVEAVQVIPTILGGGYMVPVRGKTACKPYFGEIN